LKAPLKAQSPGRNAAEDNGKVDVVVLTKNSEEQLERCLSAVYRNVPVNRLIIVDGYSTDKTLDIVKEFKKEHRNVLLIQDSGWRARARQIGIENVETEWFMFVDSDVELCERWFEKARNLVTAQVGAVWGIEVWSVIKNPRLLRLFLQMTMSIFQARGGTHDLLLRHKVVEDIKIPPTLHSFEDAYIKEWINKKGYKVIGTYDPYCTHYRPSAVWSVKSGIDTTQSAIRSGMLLKYPKLLLPYGFLTAYFVYQNLRALTKEQTASKHIGLGPTIC
jgi:glycosyltransferase involved in cell wall biosynthesis